MSERYPGGFITKSPPTLNPALGNAAPGIWTMDQVMQAVKNGTWPAYDPYFEYTTLLLHGNGTNGAQNNTFLDASTNNFTITRNGNTTQGTFSPYGDNWSNYFDGTGDYLTAPDNAAWDVGSSNWTAEAWVFPTASPNQPIIIGQWTSSYAWAMQLSDDSSRNLRGLVYNGSFTDFSGSTPLTLNAWNHCVFTRDGTTLRLYLNGVQVATNSFGSGSINTSSSVLSIGADGAGSQPFQGYLSNVRFVNGTCLYPNGTTFTPPTSPLTAVTNTKLLTCQSNRFIDNSSNNFTITRNGDVSVQRFSPFAPTAAYSTATIGGSGYFDGSGDSLALSSTSIDNFGTGDFTVEAWIYCTTVSTSNPVVVDQTTAQFAFGIAPSNYLYYGTSDTADILSSSTINGLQNSWRHIAISRTSGTSSLYLDGTRVATGSDSTNWSSGGLWIGRRASGAAFNGYISNVRVVKGTGLYSGATITVPTAPLTAVTNTQLLTNFTNAGIIDNAMMNDLETVGNAQISTSVKKYGTGSLAFDGTSDGLFVPANPAYAFGTGDFTVECWINTSTTTSDTFYRRIWMTDGPTGNASGNFQIALAPTTGYVNLWDGTLDLLGTSNVCDGAWHHIAATRSGTTLRLFVDGTQQASTTYSVSVSPNSGRPRPYIGTYDGSQGDFNGYIDDLRITKGYARYTANFTPPTSQLQDQ